MDAKRQLSHAQHVGFVSLQIGGVPLASAPWHRGVFPRAGERALPKRIRIPLQSTNPLRQPKKQTAFFNASITESDIKEAGQGALEIAMQTELPEGRESHSTLKSSRHGFLRSVLWAAGIF